MSAIGSNPVFSLCSRHTRLTANWHMDRFAGTYSTHAIIQTHSTQTSNHEDILERKLCTYIPKTKTNVSNYLPLPARHTVEGGLECGDMLQQMAPCLLLIFLSFFCHLWRRTHTLQNRPPSSKLRMRVMYHERCRSPQIKVCWVSSWFFLSSHVRSAHHYILVRLKESESHSDTAGVCSCEQTILRLILSISTNHG